MPPAPSSVFRGNSAGVVLMVTVGVLGVLCLLAVAFVTMAQLERRASQQRGYAVKAAFLARSGLEDALARLEAGQDPELSASRYLGEDWNADGVVTAGAEADGQVYRPTPAGSRPDTDACPAREALRPTFFQREPASGLPQLAPVEGRLRGISGRLAGDAADLANTYSLKVTSGGFYVNGGPLGAGDVDADGTPDCRDPDAGYNVTLTRMLGTLAEALDREDGSNDGFPVDQTDGEKLVSLRPPGGWRSFDQIRDTALAGSQAKLDAFVPFLTLRAWDDKKVIRPNAAAALANTPLQAWADIKLGYGTAGSRAPDFDRFGGEILGRAPVDLAWARTRRPALLALLGGLRGLYLNEVIPNFATVGTLREVGLTLDWTATSDDARRVADYLLSATSEIGTWSQWDALCDGVPASALSGVPYQQQAKRDLLKANFNPNSDLNKFNPDASLSRLVDKSDLLAYSTEFNLLPRSGGRLCAVGRLTDGQGRRLAERTLCMEVAPQDLIRLTCQSEFVAENLGDLQVAGDESDFRLYGRTPFITPSRGIGKTFGYRSFGGDGFSLQTGPEPHTVWATGGHPAVYDGQVRLATLETEDAQGPAAMKFLATWESDFAGDYSGGGGDLANATPTDTAQAQASNPVWHPSSLGTLYPDGIYIEKGRQPGYATKGNMAPSRGTLSFWVKPNCDVSRYPMNLSITRSHLYVNNTRTNGLVTTENSTGNLTSAVFIVVNGVQSQTFCKGFTIMWESDYYGDIGKEQQRSTPASRTTLPHHWYLLTCFWDMAEPSGSDGTTILIDRGQAFGDKPNMTYGGGMTGPPVDFTQPDGYTVAPDPSVLPPAVFYLGTRGNDFRNASWQLGLHGQPDATLDEFAIYDFGPAATARTVTETFAQSRFESGRYYKESLYPSSGGLATPLGPLRKAGEYFSAPVWLGAVRLKRLAWTQVVPLGLRSPTGAAPEDGDPAPDGGVLLELCEVSGAAYLQCRSGSPLQSVFMQPAGQMLDRDVSHPFRFHAVFQPNLDVAGLQSKAILDSLALDDVTLTYRQPGQPRIQAWGSGECPE